MVLLSFLTAFPSLSCGAALMLFCMFRWSRPAERRRLEYLMLTVTYGLPLQVVTGLTTYELARLRTVRYDLYIYRIDNLFGQPSFALARWLSGHAALKYSLALCYNLLPAAMVGVFAVYLFHRPLAEAFRVLRAFILNLALAVPIYILIPVCGPAFVFSDFPAAQHNVFAHPIVNAEIPNGMPSIHTSTALLVFWLLRHWPAGRVAGVVFLLGTILATLGHGQHYLFDLLCAVPYAVVIWRISANWSPTGAPARSSEPLPGTLSYETNT